jgi:hypothetical protein
MNKQNTLLYLKICVILILCGRAYQYIFFSAPFGMLLYFSEFLKPLVEEQSGLTWHAFLSLPEIDIGIKYFTQFQGFLFLTTSLLVVFLNKKNIKWLQLPVIISGFALIFLAVLLLIEKNYRIGQFIEYTIQFSLPFILVAYISDRLNKNKLLLLIKIIIALTFFGHGLYAIGYYPVPGYFVDMTITILNCSETFARQLLYLAGILDIVIAIGIFLPHTTIVKYLIIWAILWGFATAIARVAGNFYFNFILNSLHQNTYEMLYRLPHGIIPLLLLLNVKTRFLVAGSQNKRILNFNRSA